LKEKKIFLVLLAVFLAAYFIPFSKLAVQGAFVEAFLVSMATVTGMIFGAIVH
jgi:hypothetical protein